MVTYMTPEGQAFRISSLDGVPVVLTPDEIDAGCATRWRRQERSIALAGDGL
jgi:hypothetical protein